MNKAFVTGLLFLAMGASSALAANSVTLNKKEVKAVMSIMTGKALGGDCKTDSDCGNGQVCVGIGICVPTADSDEFKGRVPSLFGK